MRYWWLGPKDTSTQQVEGTTQQAEGRPSNPAERGPTVGPGARLGGSGGLRLSGHLAAPEEGGDLARLPPASTPGERGLVISRHLDPLPGQRHRRDPARAPRTPEVRNPHNRIGCTGVRQSPWLSPLWDSVGPAVSCGHLDGRSRGSHSASLNTKTRLQSPNCLTRATLALESTGPDSSQWHYWHRIF